MRFDYTINAMTYFFETYGCQMNVAESNGVEQVLKARGWQAGTAEDADLVIINTCSVRITAENRVFGRLGFFSAQKKKRTVKILVMGCMAERLKAEFSERFPFVDFVVGIGDRAMLEKIFADLEDSTSGKNHSADVQEIAQASPIQSSNEKYLFANSSYREGDFQSFVPIMNGCNNFCSYCIVPYVRGREVSRDVSAILREVEMLGSKGVKEITLLGQNVNSYSGMLDGEKLDFPDLLERICRACEKTDSIRWVRFMSSHPKDMSEKLIEVIAREPRVCKAVHLPVQNGSNPVLQAMNRKYTAEHYLALVAALRKKNPGIAITTDILVGFPGETEADLEATLELMRTVEFNSCFMYHYNPREGTKAFDFPNRIDEPVKIARLQKVIDLQQAITEKKMHEKIGSTVAVLLESHSRNDAAELFGHSEAGEMVVVKNTEPKNIGRFIQVRLECVNGKTFIGSVVENPET